MAITADSRETAQHRVLAGTLAGHPMAGIARNIELYNLAYRLAWKHISERQKREYPNVATFLHDAIRHQLKEGATEPVFIAAAALKNIETLTRQNSQ